MPIGLVIASVVGAAIVGWLAGMLTFTQSRRWCTTCGKNLGCANPKCRAFKPAAYTHQSGS